MEVSNIEVSGANNAVQTLNWFKLRCNDDFGEECQKMIDLFYKKYGEYLPKGNN
jgi:hypothetical protein